MAIPDNPWSQPENPSSTESGNTRISKEYDGFHHKKWTTLTQDEIELWTTIVNNENDKDEVERSPSKQKVRRRSRKRGCRGKRRQTLIELQQKNTNPPSAAKQHDCTNHEPSNRNHHYHGEHSNGLYNPNYVYSQKFHGHPSYHCHDGRSRNQYSTGRNIPHQQKALSSHYTHPSYHQVSLYQKPPPGNDAIEARHNDGIPHHHQVSPPQSTSLEVVLVYDKQSKLLHVKTPVSL